MTRKLTISTKKTFCKKIRAYRPEEPKIIISGAWLRNAGFKIGDKININVNANSLLISK